MFVLSRQRRTIITPLFCITLVGLLQVSKHLPLRINTSSSMPIGVYRVVDAAVERGSIVSVCLPKPISQFGLDRQYIIQGDCPSGAEPVIKQVIAMSGDTVELSEDGVSVNGRLLPMSSKSYIDDRSRLLPAIDDRRYLIAPKYIWLYGNHSSRSWDSRYYGAINENYVQSILMPVITW